jgi:putative copper export protein
MDGHVTHVAVRMIHVLAATVLAGGSLGLAVGGWSAEGRGATLTWFAARYEVAFWLALGAIVATGVGNLGVYGTALPGPDTDWGRAFSVKLALVFGLVMLSAVRVLVVVRLRDLRAETDARVLARWYAASAGLVGAIVCAAVWLAHG